MAVKVFHISDPEELREISKLTKGGSTTALAAVWNAARNRGKTTRFDISVFAVFSGDKRRTAQILHMTNDNRPVPHAALKYNQALKWCEEYLEQTELSISL